MTSSSLDAVPFYRQRIGDDGLIEPWTLDALEEWAAAHGDPFAGRLRSRDRLRVALQLEATSEPPVWGALDAGELDAWAAGLGRLWARFGISTGETLAFFDYGSSPLVLLSSASFVAYLKRGAAERLGITVVCNDGVASMAARMATILEAVRPEGLVVRRDVLAPFAEAVRTTGAPIDAVRWIAITEPEGAPAKTDVQRYHAEWKLPVRRLLRADAAYFVAGDCDACALFHVDPRLYAVDTVFGGEIVVTARFAETCPAVRYNIGPGEVVSPGCPREPRAFRLAWE
ncbi:MAG: hypothetical protein QOD06_2517 [Candidatus Binatota bacterium]|jgi:phenylacetate-coenzyme A ligase PaaK-like adenylate-forming protein|nr:hypothetical protein [Candidatus Binatota bacterium]